MPSLATVVLACLPFIVFAQSPPCGTRDCPPFSVVSTVPDGYELRRYSASTWVTTVSSGRGGFRKLYQYITGANDQSAKIEMTVPVLRAKRASGTTMMFYLPTMASVPVPTDPTVTILNVPEKDFYVRVFYTNTKPSKQEYLTELQNLKNAIGSDALYDTSVTYVAGYHAPWFTGLRHNEIWLAKL